LHGFYAVDGPASRRYFVLNSTFRWRVALPATERHPLSTTGDPAMLVLSRESGTSIIVNGPEGGCLLTVLQVRGGDLLRNRSERNPSRVPLKIQIDGVDVNILFSNVLQKV
jgi:hypothetical protein